MVLITNTKIDQTVILIGHRVVYSRGAYHNLLAQNQKLASIPRHLSCLGLAAGETKGSSRLISTKDGFIVACGNSTAVQLQHLPVSRIISLSSVLLRVVRAKCKKRTALGRSPAGRHASARWLAHCVRLRALPLVQVTHLAPADLFTKTRRG